MMKFGIVGDIHANLEALKVVIAQLKKEEVDSIFCLGDIVGYNANPKECIELLWENKVNCISGNHDRFTSGEIDAVIRPETRYVIEYTKKTLSKEQMDFISCLPEERYFEDIFLFVHGSPRHKDEYINSLQTARTNLHFLKQERPFVFLCFYGHTHLPYLISSNSVETDIHQSKMFQLDRHLSYLVNVGSVGQPRDQCPLASCAVYDTEAYTISYHRLEYNIPETQKKIRDAGFDNKLAERLARGK